ncbi:MAG: UvrD-helicase domain-containing protein, partial [Brevefilum sp.]|nr:UvrD-helicase domain-containing protein [Brevefilum sp.]
KTLTLVARYTSLLAEGIPPRRIAAITFSTKAAREMRARVRKKLFELGQSATSEGERQAWVALSLQMDAARISTIHSLCAEILRAHPAEAGIDPRFEIIDESLSAALRIQAVEDTLKTLVEEAYFAPLLKHIATYDLTEMLKDLLNRRLEASEVFNKQVGHLSLVTEVLHQRLNNLAIRDLIDDLRGLTQRELVTDAGDKLAQMVQALLELWEVAERALAGGDLFGCTAALYQARRTQMDLRAGKRDSWVKAHVAQLRDNFDQLVNPITGGAKPNDASPSPEAEALFSDLLPRLRKAFDTLCQTYQALLDARQALDFDDLEQGAVKLLRDAAIRENWQAELDAILVDEFQDTNRRQQDIIEALAGPPGRLFIVGDMRQSIYRFRQADVTVFKHVQDRIRAEGGQIIDLPLTYRAHEPLLDATGDLLVPAIGIQPDPTKDYYVPYTPMIAYEKKPPEGVQSPYVEFVIGAGENAEAAHPTAAQALAARLHQLKAEGQIQAWDEVALLFRASTGYADYEAALEEMGIPFVTVAGRGFYDRPEIRDLVNILRALADPIDDLAFAGLLRSPAFGLSDAALYLLRQSGLSYWQALQGDLSALNEADRERANQTVAIVSQLLPLVDRIPVAELLTQIVNATHYRAILATADVKEGDLDTSTTGGRLWRNLDKLLSDALASEELRVRNYLEVLETLNDAGAREGEASAEAQGSVQLMTIHAAKGLEFNVVVMAAAGRGTRSSSELAYLFEELGVAFKLDPPPMLYNLAKHLDKDQDEMERLRLLYVALTRAKHKLIISCHATPNKDGDLTFTAWAKELVRAAGIMPHEFHQAGVEPFDHPTEQNNPLRVWCLWDDHPLPQMIFLPPEEIAREPEIIQRPLYQPIEEPSPGPAMDDEGDEVIDPASWRATAQDGELPGKVLGKLVHQALHRWCFPGDPQLEKLLQNEALQAGLVNESQRADAIDQAVERLERLRQHPLWAQIDTAAERHHELPYAVQVGRGTENRFIDLLYRDGDSWRIIDFKTDPIHTPGYREELLLRYSPQVLRYQHAVKQLLGVDAKASICFLDDNGQVTLVELG